MDYLRLALALALPWLGGYLWLAAIENRLSTAKPNSLRQIGYGLFIGYAGLHAIVLACSALTGAVTFWPLLTALALVTAPAAALVVFNRPVGEPGNTAAGPSLLPPPVARTLFWILIAWSSLHLLLVAIEIIHRPVFPWDAWLNWMYRAKAWFYSGQIIPMDHPLQWLRGTGDSLYNVAGNHYPTFSPVLALWAAISLGYWSETLVNLPTLFCGIAMGLALYGQCREFGMEKWLSALCTYFLLSLPLMGTHLSLAGQADIWMAGFTGLGFVALLHGIIRNSPLQILLGLGMTAMGIAAKVEGAVWFLAALLMLALTRRMGLTLACLVLTIVMAALGWLVEVTYLDLPLLGGIGLAEGRIHIPLLGSYALQTFELWDDYLDNFFKNDTWHLLWTLLLLSAVSLWFLPAGILRRAISSFYGVLLAAQLFIFKGTESGQWADDWTAINRLPLHFAPPLVFCLVIVAQAFLHRSANGPRPGLVLRPALLGLIITLAGAMVYLVAAYPGDGGLPRTFTASDMRMVAGDGRLAGNIGLIEQYDNNVAILSSGPVQLGTEQFQLVNVTTAGPNRNRATFFWRNGSDPENLHSTEIPGRGTRWISLDALPQWQGQVSEIGIIFYSDQGKSVAFHGLEIAPQSLALQLNKLAFEWSETSHWSQSSAHWLASGTVTSAIPLPILMSVWVCTALLVALVIARRTQDACIGALFCALAAWSVLDLRWTSNSLAQAGETIGNYPLASAQSLDFGDDHIVKQLVDSARPAIEKASSRTIIASEDRTMRFEMLRAKYHALPAAIYVHEGPVETAPAKIADNILILRKRYTEPGYQPPTAADYAGAISKRSGLQAKTVFEKPGGLMLSITPKVPPFDLKSSYSP